MAWELSLDHAHCFGKDRLPAKVWSNDPLEIAAWFEAQGTRIPPVPSGVAELGLVGARYCPLLDRVAAHLYYAGEERRLSVAVQEISFWRNKIGGRVELQARLGVDGSISAVRFVEPVLATWSAEEWDGRKLGWRRLGGERNPCSGRREPGREWPRLGQAEARADP